MLTILKNILQLRKIALLFLVTILFITGVKAQYKSYKISANGDTINIVDKKELKQHKWVNTIAPLRGEPGYDEEGEYKNDKKNGYWRMYNTTGDIIGIENYMLGGKNGLQQYFSYTGGLVREESWRGYNPDAPYDTVAIYGTGSGEIIGQKVVKAEQYSVKDGDWKYYNPETGAILGAEHYDRGRLLKNNPVTDNTTADPSDSTVITKKSTVKAKPQAILEYEKKNSKKKKNGKERDGNTGL